MPDLNQIMSNIQKQSKDTEEMIIKLLSQYEDLYREGNRIFASERTASNGSLDGLEDFYRLLQVIKRNRDVVGSIFRGLKNLRPMSEFKFIEENVPDQKPKKPPKKPPLTGVSKEKPKGPPSPEINEKNIQNLKIPSEVSMSEEKINA